MARGLYENLRNKVSRGLKQEPDNTRHFYVAVTTLSDSKCVELFKGTGVMVHKRDGSSWVNGKRVKDGE